MTLMLSKKNVVPNSPQNDDDLKPHYFGHRKRLRQRFAEDPEALPDYEILELLLSCARSRGDMKPLAKTLLAQYRTFGGVLTAPVETLTRVKGMGEATAFIFQIVLECLRRFLRDELKDAPLLNSLEKVISYCRVCMAYEDVEEFRILFLDRKYFLITDQVQQRGTLDHAAVYPREILKQALKFNAGSIIMVHNHPSGDPTPSEADITITKRLKGALGSADVRLIDHIIVGRFGSLSFREHQLL